jgi:hypothetical protein
MEFAGPTSRKILRIRNFGAGYLALRLGICAGRLVQFVKIAVPARVRHALSA